MPEGPSIVILKQQAAQFAGQVVRAVSGNSKQDLQRMEGQRVHALCSWGKHFLIAFDGFAMRVHFLLFGSYRIDERKTNANGKPSSPRMSLVFDNGELFVVLVHLPSSIRQNVQPPRTIKYHPHCKKFVPNPRSSLLTS